MAAKYNPNKCDDAAKVIKKFQPMVADDEDGNHWTLTPDENTTRFTLRKNENLVFSHVLSTAVINKANQLGITLKVV